MLNRTVIVVALAVTAGVVMPPAVAAFGQQTGVETPLVVPGSRLDQPSPVDQLTLAELLDHFVIYADRQRCGTLSLVDPAARNVDRDAVFLLGARGSPAHARPWAH